MTKIKDSNTDKPVALLPDQLLSSVAFSKAEGYVLVRGQARRFTHTGQSVFGTLSGTKRSMTFMCPADRSPANEGQKVIIGGFLRIIPSKVHNGFDVRIDGEVIGLWNRDYKKTELIVLNRNRPIKTSLTQFIQNQKSVKKLLILSTKVGLSEFHSIPNSSESNQYLESVVRTYDAKKFLEDFDSAINKHRPFAVAVIGGTDESGNTANIWDDAKVIDRILNTNYIIFSAVGNSDSFTLLDKYADESFVDSAQFRYCLDEAIQTTKSQNRLNKKLQKVTEENRALSGQNSDADRQLSILQKKGKILSVQRNILLLISLLVMTFLVLKVAHVV